MTRIGNADHVLVLLREKLQRLQRARGSRTARTGAPQKGTQSPLARLQAGTALDGLSDEDFRRTVVRAVLAEELGEGVANDPNFQVLAEDVFRILNSDEAGRELIERATAQIRMSD